MEKRYVGQRGAVIGRVTGVLVIIAGILLAAGLCMATPHADNPVPSIFRPHSTPADSIVHLSSFVLVITALIFLVVATLLTYAVVRFRNRASDNKREPAQVHGSTQIELTKIQFPQTEG